MANILTTRISVAATKGPNSIAFSYGDVSPELITNIPSATLCLRARITILTPFDGEGATLSIGDLTNPQAIMSVNQDNPFEVGIYQTTPSISYVINTPIYLFIVPGAGATQGNGYVTVEY